MRINPEEKQKLFKLVKHRLGAPVRKIQLDDDQMDSLLEIATQDYVEYIQNYIIEHQWPALLGLNVSEDDLARALVTRNYDLVTQYTYSYSKIVGLGAGEGGYEMKKDYFELQRNVQMYQIPANREINEILWFSPSTIDNSIIDPFIGMWSNTFGGQNIGLGTFHILPAFDILLRASDRNLKNRILGSEMIYKITNGPNGTKYVHLMNTPGGNFDMLGNILNRSKVWYWYYDLKQAPDCIEANKDIIKSPADVPLDNMSYDELNDPSKIWIRRYFTAVAKETLGRVRGTFNGKIPVPEADMTVEYQSLLSEGKDEMITLKLELKERLERLSPLNTLKRVSEEAQYINASLKFRAMPKPIRVI